MPFFWFCRSGLYVLFYMLQRGNGDLREDEIKYLLREYMYKHRFVVSSFRNTLI